MHTRKSNLPIWTLVFVLMIMLLSTVPVAYAQDEPPPPTQPAEIIGGAPATPGEWPWQVALVVGSATGPNYFNAQFCGGSLIAPQWVLTAAHCITDGSGNVIPASAVDIVAGIYNLSSPTGGYQQRDVTQIIRHASYNPSNNDNDIALLKLSSPVSIGGSGATTTGLVPLVPPGIGSLAGTSSWVTGWGNTIAGTPSRSNELREVQVPIMTNTVCNDANHYGPYPDHATANQLCAGFDTGGKDSCQGDSGGPLVVFNGGQWKLAGITSWGYSCGLGSFPGVYTRVSNYGNWVNQRIGLTTLVSPSGAITDTTPTFTWNAVPTMTHYYLWIKRPSGTPIKTWYTAAAAGCAGGTGTCSVTPATALGGGAHTWWIQTWNPAGYGPWSAAMNFSLPIPAPPGVATLVSPSGAITDTTPTYTWNAVSGATYYYLWVNGPTGNLIKTWYTATAAGCAGGTGTCSVTPAVTLGSGAHTWWIRTWNSAGSGPWSTPTNFSLP